MSGMEGLILLLTGVIALPFLLLASRHDGGKGTNTAAARPRQRRRRCPNCGSPVIDHGSYWECPWCGDHGLN